MNEQKGVRAVQGLAAADAKILDGLGIELVSADEGVVTLAMPVVDTMINSQGFCHGGFLYTLADTAAAYAAVSVGGGPATVDASVAYLAPARLGDRLAARARVLKAGARVGHSSVRLVRGDDETIAVFRSNWLAR